MQEGGNQFFNSATAVKPWKHGGSPPGAMTSYALQFGHGSEAVETFYSAVGGAVKTKVFNSATAVKPWKRQNATAPPSVRMNLQFGHGSEAVETGIRGRKPIWCSILQFGHGSEAVETQIQLNVGLLCGYLQFGHGSEAVETGTRGWRRGLPVAPSIRPRQ